MNNCQNYDYTKCSIKEGHIRHIKIYVILIIIILIGLIYYLLKKKYYNLLGFIILLSLIIIIIDHQITKLTYPKWNTPKKIPSKYDNLMVKML